MVISAICGSGYLLTSMTLSRNRTDRWTVRLSFSQSTEYLPASYDIIRARLTEPRLQDSNGSRGCSPHGLVLSISPSLGVGLSLLILSMNTIPGSPFRQAMLTIMSNTLRASSFERGCRFLGFTRS